MQNLRYLCVNLPQFSVLSLVENSLKFPKLEEVVLNGPLLRIAQFLHSIDSRSVARITLNSESVSTVGAAQKKQFSLLRAFFENMKDAVEHLKIGQLSCADSSPASVMNLIEPIGELHKLTKLELHLEHWTRENNRAQGAPDGISIMDVIKPIGKLRQLTRLEICLSDTDVNMDVRIADFFASWPKMEELRLLFSLKYHPSLVPLLLPLACLQTLARSCPHVKSLVLPAFHHGDLEGLNLADIATQTPAPTSGKSRAASKHIATTLYVIEGVGIVGRLLT